MARKLKTAVARAALTDFEPREMSIDFRSQSARIMFDVTSADGSFSETYEVTISNGFISARGTGALGSKSHTDRLEDVPPGQIPPPATPTRTAFDRLVGGNGVIKAKTLRDIEDLIDTLGMMPG